MEAQLLVRARAKRQRQRAAEDAGDFIHDGP